MAKPKKQANRISGNIKVNDVIEVIYEKDDVLKKFINTHFFPKESSLNSTDINKNIDTLRNMNNTQRALVKARAESFAESYDVSKYFPTLVAIFTLVLGLYALVREISGNAIWVTLLSIVVTAFVGVYLARLYVKSLDNRPTAVFFNELLKNLEYKK